MADTGAKAESLIQAARRSFNAELLDGDYEQIHADDRQLQRLIQYLEVTPGGVYLDLATGNGYAGFEIAAHHEACRVIAVDIAGKAIARNTERAAQLGLSNIAFRSIDGLRLDFPSQTFDGVICRYAFHHFPQPPIILRDIAKILKDGGRLVLSDAIRNDGDDEGFINRFQDLKQDGHVRMYKRDELVELMAESGFEYLQGHMTSLAFSRVLDSAYRTLLRTTSSAAQQGYGLSVKGDQAFLRLEILNAVFSKAGG